MYSLIRREVVLGPVHIADGWLTMRSPRLRDATEWSAARLANRQWLERAFPAWGDDWAAEQSPAAWIERWWRLKRAARSEGAAPFVLMLNGELIGEIGIDAVDQGSATGEGSVWMVRNHGSATVMHAATLLLIQHAFTRSHPLDRLISPVASSSRKGRGPGMSAAGLEIEGVLPRKVGEHGLVDHDIWAITNTAQARGRLTTQLASLSVDSASTPASSSIDKKRSSPRATAGPVLTLLVACVRVGVRTVQRSVRARRDHDATLPVSGIRRVGTAIVSVQAPESTAPTWGRAAARGSGNEWAIVRDGTPVGTIRHHLDEGTGTATISAALNNSALSNSALGGSDIDRDTLKAALSMAIEAAPDWAHGALSLQVSVPVGSGRSVSTVPDDGMLGELGLTHLATFAANPEGRSGWPGEQRWGLVLS